MLTFADSFLWLAVSSFAAAMVLAKLVVTVIFRVAPSSVKKNKL